MTKIDYLDRDLLALSRRVNELTEIVRTQNETLYHLVHAVRQMQMLNAGELEQETY